MWLSITLLSCFCILIAVLYRPQRRSSDIPVYYRRIRVELSAVRFRRDVFKEVEPGEIINIRQDPTKEYNGNAIGAFTQNGKLLGYIPRDQRKLLQFFRHHPGLFAMIYKKFRKGAQISIFIEVFFPLKNTSRSTTPRDVPVVHMSRYFDSVYKQWPAHHE